MNQTGSGKRCWKQTAKKPTKKRKALTSTARTKQTKKRRKTSVSKEIFSYEFRAFQIARMHQE